jgi:hypothetical protein
MPLAVPVASYSQKNTSLEKYYEACYKHCLGYKLSLMTFFPLPSLSSAVSIILIKGLAALIKLERQTDPVWEG